MPLPFIINTVGVCVALATEYVLAAVVLPLSLIHISAMILEALRLKPLINCELCLGEGTGAVAVLPLLEMTTDIYQTMSTFEQFDMEPYQPLT